MPEFEKILKRYWGYDTFRPLQREVIGEAAAGCDALVLMPTGGGKSLTYQVPAMARPGICVVITPLIALMKDQIDALRRRGIQALAIHSGMTPRQVDITLDNAIYGDYKFLYVSPERIESDLFRARFARMNVSLIAIDEAHCISQWGYDFRPSYLKIARLRPLAPSAPVLALTASATPIVVEDILEKLEFRQRNILRMSFSRENLSCLVRHTENKPEHLMRILDHVPGTAIVYVRTRDRAEKLSALLVEKGVAAEFYHGGLGYQMRSIRQENWLSGKTRVMVATNAFGMGIDKADVRVVAHYDLCDSIEAYYQEAGRAGRDGRPAYAVLLHSEEDRRNAGRRIDLEFPPVEKIWEVYEAIFNYCQIAVGAGKNEGREFNVYDFCSRYKIFIPVVLNAIKILQLNGYMVLTDEADHPPRILFTVGREDLYKIRIQREELDHIIRVLLRTYTGIFTEAVPVNVSEIAHLSGYTLEHVHELLKRLWQLHIIKYIPGSRSSLLLFTEERLPVEAVRISPESYRIRREVAAARLEAMAAYAANTAECRSLYMQRYFGEETDRECGKCDICREKRKRVSAPGNDLPEKILHALASSEADLHALVGRVGGEAKEILEAVRLLLADGELVQDKNGKLRLNS
ncbi:MAG: RecQ family ATP-dependent DNA helicase [Rikenellaceae bacterium]|nr:RecQ family ATP-dependent DNA helicase [Rikenellaceae bacterium]